MRTVTGQNIYHIKCIRNAAISFLVLLTTVIEAKVSLPQFFSSNMVLQRDMPVHIWGWAEKNEEVYVTFNELTKKVKTAKNGRWDIHLPSMTFGGPLTMIIKGSVNTIRYDNILIGDVWLCSGQSNMEFRLAGDYTAEEEIKAPGNFNIRLLKVPRTIQTKEKDDIHPTAWIECNSVTTPGFSAVAYFFGKNLQKNLNVPIGLIEDCFGATNIETWTSWETSINTEAYALYHGQTVEEAFKHSGEEMNSYFKALWENKDEGNLQKWFLPCTESTGWKTMYAPKAWDGELRDDDGIVWFRRTIVLPDSVDGKSGVLHLGIGQSDQLYLNGEFVKPLSESENCDFDVKLKKGVNYIAVRFLDMGGRGGFWRRQAEDFYLDGNGIKYPLEGDWEYKPALLLSKLNLTTLYLPGNFASLLFNGMIHPLVGYCIKGVIWYQGEGNLGNAYEYRNLFTDLISDWREKWGYDFPFLWVQLTSFQPPGDQPEESEWAELRESQNLALRLPGTGQAVITDIGDARDVHPKNKKDVGYRLAQSALKVSYGRNILGSGPVYNNMKINDNKIILNFSNTGTGLSTREKNKYGYVYGFSIAGDDRKFVWAKAFIEGNNVIVFSEKVADPVAVRYGWANNATEINIVNSDGLLASPFRSDNWKVITE